jgi:excisionase family DNA binding protein
MQGDGPKWLTVSQAAARLGVSERTVRRRCESGKLPARLESTATGAAWLLDPAAFADLRTPAEAAAIGAATLQGTPTPEASAPTAVGAAMLRTPAVNEAERREADLMAALISEKDGRIADLQKQVDALHGTLEREQKAHAETRRVLAFNLSTPTLAPPASNPASVPQAPADAARLPRRHPRPLWALLIGYKPKG